MRFLFVLIFTLSLLSTFGQGFRVRHYAPGASTNLSKAIYETTPGNYITAGIIVDSVSGANMLCLMGLNNHGQVTWRKKYGSNKFLYLNNPFIARSFYKQGNYLYHAGGVRDSNNKYIGVLIKFDLNGDTLWKKVYRDTQQVYPQMVTGSVDGGFLITGYFQIGGRPAMLIKTDATGNELWRKKIGKSNPNVQDGKSIIQDSATKKIIISGYQYIGGNDVYDNVVILDSLGNQPVRFSYTDAPGGAAVDMIQTLDKNIVIVGCQYSGVTVGGYNLQKSFIVKFNPNNPNPPIWKINNFDRLSRYNAFTCITEMSDSTLLVGGLLDTMRQHNLNTNAFTRITKISKNGVVLSNRNYDYKINAPMQANNHTIKSINLTSDGGFVAAVEVTNFPAPNPFFFVKFDSTGCDSSLAYCQSQISTVGLKENKITDGLKISLYPNPAQTAVTLACYIEQDESLRVELKDLLGRLVYSSEINNNTENIVPLNNCSNGVYIITVSRNKELLYKTKLIKQE